jgi:predicted nucleotide-binding protein (sugar kinase/HSP70/actin superfamily)
MVRRKTMGEERTTTKISNEQIRELRKNFNEVIEVLDKVSFSKSDAKGKVKPLIDRIIKFREFLVEREQKISLADISEDAKSIITDYENASEEQKQRIREILVGKEGGQ